VEFEKPVDAKGNIEVWLQRLVDGMQDTVKQVRLLCKLACLAAWGDHPYSVLCPEQSSSNL
jgi:hypothetical protein